VAKVSGIVTCFDNMPHIEACLESMRWVDELIVVDSFSTDGTAELARKIADRVFQREYTSESGQRNWAVERASHPWIVLIDSDEVIPTPLREEIRATLRNPRYNRYKVFRRGIFLGREMKHGGWNRDKNNLLFRQDRYRFDGAEVHSRLLPEDKYGLFQNRLDHYTHRSIDEFVVKSNRYATLVARRYYQRGKRGTAAKIFSHCAFNFIRNYFFRLGFLDGARGLVSAVLSSGYVAEKYAKLWELEKGKPDPGSGREHRAEGLE